MSKKTKKMKKKIKEKELEKLLKQANKNLDKLATDLACNKDLRISLCMYDNQYTIKLTDRKTNESRLIGLKDSAIEFEREKEIRGFE